jgi:phosphoribosylformylglycinamidine cyclo-ligase
VLVGGETAEHPGVMADDAFDLVGFCIGFVELDDVIDRSLARDGDAIIGLASSGLHSNGYSLVRKLVDEGKLPLSEELLTPTRLYSPTVLDVVDAVREAGLRIGGLAHVTGGGLRRNLPRALPDSLGADVDPATWPQPQIFERIAMATGMLGSEMRATFNCGIGFAIVVEPKAIDGALDVLEAAGIEAWEIGTVVSTTDLDGERYIEE